jgi:type IV secretory pathway component VirB8
MSAKQTTLEMPSTEKAFEAALSWEASRIEILEKSEQRAWNFAKISLGLAGLAVFAIAVMMPLKETKPYVWRINGETGLPELITELTEKSVSGNEASDKFWLSKYVGTRERYDWYTLQADYDAVGLMSSPEVGADYGQLFKGEKSKDKVLGNKNRVDVKIVSVVPTGNDNGTIRFTTTQKRVDMPTDPGEVRRWVATVAYKYQPEAKMSEADRLVNPFGFTILTYRVDPEIGGSQ